MMGRMMTITSTTRLHAVLGDPIVHSRSPLMQNAAFAALRLDAVYLALRTPAGHLGQALDVLGMMGFRGVNLTIPLKERALEFMTSLDDSAATMRAVNTVVFGEGGAVGYNTDGVGFARAVEEAFGSGFAGKTVLVLGLGGAGRATALTAALEGATRLLLANRSPERAEAVAGEIRALRRPAEVECVCWPASARVAREADLIVQATSLGMQGDDDASLLPAGAFRTGQEVYDLVYTSAETPIMRMARSAGAAAANGLGMLVHQGARAFELWTGQTAPVEVMKKALEGVVKA